MLNETVVIIGGGITGLTSAWLLEEAGFRDIHLLEASDYLGGKIKTIRESGFLIETGPDALMVTKPGIRPFLRKLGLEDQLIEPESRHFYILHKGRLQAVPAGFASMVPADIPDFLKSPLLSWRGKARMLAERLVPSRKQNRDESLAAFVERRFGHEVLTQLAEPLFSGVYAAPANDLSIKATFPHFHEMERKHGSITSAVLSSRKQNGPPSSSPFRSFKAGMDTLPYTLFTQLEHTTIWRNTSLVNMQYEGGNFLVETNQETLKASRVISTIPSYRLAPAIGDMAPNIPEKLQSIPFASTAIVTLAYKREAVPDQLEATGFLIPKPEQTALSACTWSSEKWQGRAPKGYVLFRCFFSNQDPKLLQKRPYEEWENLADQSLKNILNIEQPPTHGWLHTWQEAQPQYKMGHPELIRQIDEALQAYPGFYLAGSPYRGVGIPDCIRQAQSTVEQICRSAKTEQLA